MIDASSKEVEVILKAARIIRNKGFDATSVNDISEATGLTKGGLYHYIESKRDLLYQITRLAMDVTISEVVEKVRHISDPEEQLRELIRRHVALMLKDEGVLSVLSEEVSALEPHRAKEIRGRKREVFEFVRDILIRLRERGRLAAADPTAAAFSILGMGLFSVRWYRPDGRLSTDQVAEEIAALAVRAVTRRQDETSQCP